MANSLDDSSFRYYQKFVRVRDYADQNAADIATTDGPIHLQTLKDTITALEKAGANKHRGNIVPLEVQIEHLHAKLSNIARTAHSLARTAPGFDALFEAPKGSNQREVLDCAKRMLSHLLPETDDTAEEIAAKAARVKALGGLGLGANFPALLKADSDLVDTDDNQRHQDDNTSHQNTAAIGRLVKQGVTYCQLLDAIFHNIYMSNTDKLHAWVIANHVERPAAHHTEPPTPPTPPPA